MMPTELEKVRELHAWNRRIMSLCGCWPLDRTYITFYIGFVYFALQALLIFIDLFKSFGDTDLVIGNLPETTQQLMVGIKLLVVRHSASLPKIVKQIEAGAIADNYRDQKEISLYLEYTDIGRIFFQVFGFLAFITEVGYFIMPLEPLFRAAIHNEPVPYILPYRSPFVNVSNTPSYVLLYISQLPMLYYSFFHTIAICFLCTIIVHVAGEMSILAYRIRNINKADLADDSDTIESAFRDITITHLHIIKTAQTIDGIFNVVLLEELVITTGVIGLSAYTVIATSMATSMFEVVTFAIYGTVMAGVILIYCATGDFLIRESMNVEAAYFECQWYTMPKKFKQNMLICMNRAQRPLQLTAGKFYIFELTRFSSVLKTSMAYISMLRTVV